MVHSIQFPGIWQIQIKSINKQTYTSREGKTSQYGPVMHIATLCPYPQALFPALQCLSMPVFQWAICTGNGT